MSTISTAETAVQNPAQPDRAVVRLGYALIVCMFPFILDSTITNVALNTLARDFATSIATIQWVSTAYMLAMAVVIPAIGWAEQRLGSKKLLQVALVAFLVGSVGSALSWNIGSLVAFRVVQGAAAGVAITLIPTLLMRAAGGKNLGKLMALLGLPSLVIPMLGPVIGGAIVTATTWRWMFWINVPLCAIGFFLAAKLVRGAGGQAVQPLDVTGLALAGVGSAVLLYGLASAGSDGTFADPVVISCIAGGVVLLAGFVFWTLLRTSHPIVDLHLLRVPSFAAACVTVALAGFALNSGALIMPLFFQRVCGTTALMAGVMLIPQGLGSLATRSLVGIMTDKIGARWVVIACVVVTVVTTVPLALADARTAWWVYAIWLFLRGCGLSGILLPATTVAYLDVDADKVASSSIIVRTVQQVGGAFGVAVVAVALEWAASAGGLSLTGSFHAGFWMVLAMTAVTGAAAMRLPVRRR